MCVGLTLISLLKGLGEHLPSSQGSSSRETQVSPRLPMALGCLCYPSLELQQHCQASAHTCAPVGRLMLESASLTPVLQDLVHSWNGADLCSREIQAWPSLSAWVARIPLLLALAQPQIAWCGERIVTGRGWGSSHKTDYILGCRARPGKVILRLIHCRWSLWSNSNARGRHAVPGHHLSLPASITDDWSGALDHRATEGTHSSQRYGLWS